MSYYEKAAREAETRRDWWKAYFAWLQVKTEEGYRNARACFTIAESIDLGERYRKKSEELDELLMERKITVSDYLQKLRVIHKETYGV